MAPKGTLHTSVRAFPTAAGDSCAPPCCFLHLWSSASLLLLETTLFRKQACRRARVCRDKAKAARGHSEAGKPVIFNQTHIETLGQRDISNPASHSEQDCSQAVSRDLV